ncbi:2-dehydropantoate 2-reductase [Boudabousia marimammalium]|uniref:2-dehydropantoate 2-reductase n=1 Tax=Boudabousia marimammalium TaxID=156892 RepID=A0A1Q5PMK0_9ACTO|nr:2-dehydropantoate 2-reductase [Boudabousia marimammalium]OKL48749.1 2-dehydropantoate 2-reductase [Boudabousia marimammalium]
MRIGIAGAGAMGSRFGYMLSEAGQDVTLIDSWSDHVEAIKANGLQIDWNGESRVAPFKIVYPHEVAGTFDLIICFTKAMGLDQMLSSIQSAIGPDTALLCLLNGIGHEETVRKYVPDANFILGTTIWTAGLDGPGRAHLYGSGAVALENMENSESAKRKAYEVAELLDGAGLNASYSDSVRYSIYRKATLNGAVNAMCTILECNLNTFGSTQSSEEIIVGILNEFGDVAAHEGINLDREEVLNYIHSIFSPDSIGEHYPSMYQDLVKNNRITEIDYLNGAIARKGKDYGIPTPFCELVTLLVHAKEEIRGAK